MLEAKQEKRKQVVSWLCTFRELQAYPVGRLRNLQDCEAAGTTGDAFICKAK